MKRGVRTHAVRRAGLPGVRAVERAGFVVDDSGRLRRANGAFVTATKVKAAITRQKNKSRKEALDAIAPHTPTLPDAETDRRRRLGVREGPDAKTTLARAFRAEDALAAAKGISKRKLRQDLLRAERALVAESTTDQFVIAQWETSTPDGRRSMIDALGQRALVAAWFLPSTTRSEKEAIGRRLTTDGLALREATRASRTKLDRRHAWAQREALKMITQNGGRVDPLRARAIAEGAGITEREIWTLGMSPEAAP